MKIRRYILTAALAFLLMVSEVAYASVYTISGTENFDADVIVAGIGDFYPIEYYDKVTGKYEGVIPMVLGAVAEKTGLDIAYVRSSSISQNELVEKYKAQIVSAYVIDSKTINVKDSVSVIDYNLKGKSINIGLGFTDYAGEELINAVKTEILSLSDGDINGYIMSSTQKKTDKEVNYIPILTVLCILFFSMLMIGIRNLRQIHRKMQKNLITDNETGIGNIEYFERNFNNMISDDVRSQYFIAYITIDTGYLLAYHNEVSVSEAVKYTANVLHSYENGNEIAARIAENGFVFAYRQTDESGAKKTAAEITEKLNLYIQTEEDEGRPFFHAVIYNLLPDDKSCELLLFNLRKNCNKLLGTETQIKVLNARMMNKTVEEKQLLDSINRGFDNKEFRLYLQFIVNNKTKKITSAEALSRWHNPDKGIIYPGEYIGVLESTGRITELDYYMFEMVCRQLHKWYGTEFGELTISCNFTRITISEKNFYDRIVEISNKYVFEKSRLIIEITEDAIEKNSEDAINNITKCKKLGFRIALDDMGSGYTSLLNLCDYPIEIVKMDREILLNTDKSKGKALFEGVISLAHSLGLTVVCEGVETEEQNKFVSGTGCDYIQGWYYSKALPESECEDFYKNYTNRK